MLMSWAKEFKQFVLQGNVMDMAIGIIVGASFDSIVSSLVYDIIMPPIGLLIGGVDFSELAITLREEPMVKIKYGMFLNHIISFIILAVGIFLVIKTVNRITVKKKSNLSIGKEINENI